MSTANTSKPSITCGLDYLSASVHHQFGYDLHAAMKLAFGNDGEAPKSLGRWNHLVRFGRGAEYFGNVHQEGYGASVRHVWEHDRVFFDLKGEPLKTLGIAGVVQFLDAMQNAEMWKFTRLDIALDVFDSDLTIQHVIQNFPCDRVAPFRKRRVIYQDEGGGGVYYGSREGGREFVVYDKGAQTGDDRPWLRFELRMFGENDRAGDAFRYIFGGPPWGDAVGRSPLMRDPDQIARSLGELVCGSIQFFDKRGKHPPWWSDLRERLGSVTLALPERKKSSVRDKIRWIEKMMPKSLEQIRRELEEKKPGSFIEWVETLCCTGANLIGEESQGKAQIQVEIVPELLPF